ncbi:hypothetical protein [Rickettsiella massiliensis]|uniref:hypothetical protein n=1 Tax=Rickettsiella massiliensis TaxID=676517 RepID=UPI001F4408F5|nr:hypothetical protein [Rickettsiella massiliensis]
MENLLSKAQSRLNVEEEPLFRAFLQQYYAYTTVEILHQRSPEQLVGSALTHWQLAYQRRPGQIKVRVYNPSLEKRGMDIKAHNYSNCHRR